MESFITLILSVPHAFLKAYVWWLAWLWFLVPLGAPQIGMCHVLGLVTMVSFASFHLRTEDCYSETDEKKRNKDERLSVGFKFFISVGVTLGFWLSIWIIHLVCLTKIVY